MADPNSAGWFKNGSLPGQTGSSVIAAHNSVNQAGDGIFAQLPSLKKGDEVVYKTTSTETHFKITRLQQYGVADVPMRSIFGDAHGAHLNLITCAGKWNTITHSYPDRLIVYADLVQ